MRTQEITAAHWGQYEAAATDLEQRAAWLRARVLPGLSAAEAKTLRTLQGKADRLARIVAERRQRAEDRERRQQARGVSKTEVNSDER
jgi:hypothetical protein